MYYCRYYNSTYFSFEDRFFLFLDLLLLVLALVPLAFTLGGTGSRALALVPPTRTEDDIKIGIF